jgi:hypothetical protein
MSEAGTTRGSESTEGRRPAPSTPAPASAVAREIAGRQRDPGSVSRDRAAELRDLEALTRDEVSETLASACVPIRAVREQEPADARGVAGLAHGDPGLEALRREIDRANRTGAPLSVAFIAILDCDDGHGGTWRVAMALMGRVRLYDLVVSSAEGAAIVCALPGVTPGVARARMESVRLDLAASGIAIEVGLADLVAGDTPIALIERAGTAI